MPTHEKLDIPETVRNALSAIGKDIESKLPSVASGYTLFVYHDISGTRGGAMAYVSNCVRAHIVSNLRGWLATEPQNEQEKLIAELAEKLAKVVERWGTFASAHEGYGVLLEEVRELEEHVFKKQAERDIDAMRREGLDIAIVGLKIALMVDAGRGRK